MSKGGVSKREEHFEQYFKNQKVRKAFIVGNRYGGELKCDIDATKFSEILKRKCGFKRTHEGGADNDDYYENEIKLKDGLVLLKNTSDLLSLFKKTSVEFIFYFSGHGVVNERNGLKLMQENGVGVELEKLVEALESKEKEISDECKEKLKMTTSFRKLFILDCCRSMEQTKEEDGIKKLFEDPSYRFKEHKNTAFLYSSNIGFPSFTFLNPYFNNEFNNPYGLSVLTSSLIQRINSIRSPGRDLIKTVSIIQKDLLERYIAFKSYYQFNQKSIKDGNFVDENNFVNDKEAKNFKDDQVIIDYKNQVLSTLKDKETNINDLPTYEVFERIVADKFNILFGDITVGRFVFVEGQEAESEKDKEILALKQLVDQQREEIERLKYNSDQMDTK
ncbi:hypothetical protein DICPUDRAFT_147756 [Dictyostelium purpureum]|uniref:Peptidase C14 caspase domain-containing protein n=1 Tax=Dictyostelium purpureum TaxID=5786 RepID=F0Z9B5_DICPU|nr:uncharacterized protein DICPUDRAFT_147756 [Dictyostelium purpureum]EGC39442.1 hypothetical protein DICPUDRAFT_147756 [Dictyostelium purpureum]|eukprot:XP_003284000.1 hypothetical protein DICPUDRAFT_147756 [Dictyostelium purpureum]